MNILHIQESSESSVISLDSLHEDCLIAIFPFLPFKELLNLRYLCRSLNISVCHYLRTSIRKLQIFLNADRTEDELIRISETLDWKGDLEWSKTFYEIRNAGQVTFFEPEADWRLLHGQCHFRMEDFICMNSSVNSLEGNVASLVLFLANHVPNLTKFALLINHELYFRFVPRILASLRKLKIFFIDLTYFLPWNYMDCPETEIADAIADLPEVETLYYFTSHTAGEVLRKGLDEEQYEIGKLLRLSNGDNFVEVMLSKKLRILHVYHLAFPEGVILSKVEEMNCTWMHMSVRRDQICNLVANVYPSLHTLIIDSLEFLMRPQSPLPDDHSPFENLTVLKIIGHLAVKTNYMTVLNKMPKLVEVHCMELNFRHTILPFVIPRNHTITRLFVKFWGWRTSDSMENCVAICREYFRGLRMIKNTETGVVVEIKPLEECNEMF